jgi:hypothetical protein
MAEPLTPERIEQLRADAKDWALGSGEIRNGLDEALDALDDLSAEYALAIRLVRAIEGWWDESHDPLGIGDALRAVRSTPTARAVKQEGA